MKHDVLVQIALVLVLGIAAQWTAWRLGFPSILLLLLLGIVAGPVAGLIDADAMLGELLVPVVSLLVALILFEGGLGLNLRDIAETRDVVRRLISVGALVASIVISFAAWLFLDLPPSLAILFGALLSVTGPTVIGPLLRQVRPRGAVGPILQWEGILIDPIGAMLAVLVFEVIVAGDFLSATATTTVSLVTILLAGLIVGTVAAVLLVVLMQRYLIPDFLQNAATTSIVIAAFTVSDALASESGLFAVTMMGVVLANQRRVPIHHILEFKENIRVLILSLLFILLASRLRLADLLSLNASALIFLGVLVLVARPVSVWLSTLRSTLTWRERVFIMGVAPRGIVAAAVSSIFALALESEGVEGASLLVPYTFATIIATVTIYGLTARPLARLLGLASPDATGVLIVGAHEWARMLAVELQAAGASVLIVDANWSNVVCARDLDLTTHFGSILDDDVENELDLAGIGMLLALTSNDAVNTLACLQFRHLFGGDRVFQLQVSEPPRERTAPSSHRGRELFAAGITHDELDRRIDVGWHFATVGPAGLSETDTPDGQPERLFSVRPGGRVTPVATQRPGAIDSDARLIVLSPPPPLA